MYMYVWLHIKNDKKRVNRCFNKGVSLETIFIIKKKKLAVLTNFHIFL